MTNREAFNAYIREEIEKQLHYTESMGDDELVNYTCKFPTYRINVVIGSELSVFKLNKTHSISVGSPEQMKEWLKQEAET